MCIRDRPDTNVLCDCSESGSTLRFLVPVLAALGQNATFTGHGRLAKRPMEPLLSELSSHGVEIHTPDNGDTLPLSIRGKLVGGDFTFSGDISSQYITGLMFALPLLAQDVYKRQGYTGGRPAPESPIPHR